MDSDGKLKNILIDSNFFIGYRQTILSPKDTIISIFIPKTKVNEYVLAYKVSKRREDDIAIVNMAVKIIISKKTQIDLAFGGMGPKIVVPIDQKFMAIISKQKFDDSLLENINHHLIKYFKENLTFDAPGGEVPYRQTLALGLFQKAFNKIRNLLNEKPSRNQFLKTMIGQDYVPIKSLQLFEKTPDNQPSIDTVGRPVVVASAYKQSTGEAIFCDDIPRFENELALALVLSTKAHAKILKIDAEEALKQEGVHGFYCARDLTPEQNHWGLVKKDETVFADGLVECYGHIVGAIVAETKAQAQSASRLVKIDYEELPAILTLEEAIEQESFYNEEPMKLESGNVEKAFLTAFQTLDGSFRTGKQEHFYLEPQTSIVVPKVLINYKI